MKRVKKQIEETDVIEDALKLMTNTNNLNQEENKELIETLNDEVDKFNNEAVMINKMYENFCSAIMTLKSHCEYNNITSTQSVKIGEGQIRGKSYDILVAVNPK